MGREKKKYNAGAATQYISRKQACKKLQLSLADFRRICILKGIYPRQPANKKKVNQGSTANKTFYFMKDIQFLMHEPVINKFREYKVFVKQLRKAEAVRDRGKAELIRERKPTYHVDHIVRERYPTFEDAVRDLDDALCMCFLFARLPKSGRIYVQTINLCRRLTTEFMHYVIAKRCLKKVFISIKGIYFQAEIKNHPVTWVVAHDFPHAHPTDVDFRVMSTFTEFYSTMLGFVMFRLYKDVNLRYPPKLQLKKLVSEGEEAEKKDGEDKDEEELNLCDKTEFSSEVVKSLNTVLARVENDEDEKNDKEMLELMLDDESEVNKVLQKRQEEKKFQDLFSKCKFFISREVPRETMVFIIRSFGGDVSWEKTVGVGWTYDADDKDITHQLVDRPNPPTPHLNRVYVQPQWVFDCVNARMLIDTKEYLPGVDCPPHPSPFADESRGAYIPPERKRIIALQRGEDPGIGNEDEDLSEEEDDDMSVDDEEEDVSADEEEEEEEKKDEPEKKKGKSASEAKKDTHMVSKKEKVELEEKRLRKMTMSKKHKKLYEKMEFGNRKRQREAEALATKRKMIDEEKKQGNKKKKGKAAKK